MRLIQMKHSKQSGISLIEALVTLFVMSIGLLGMGYAQTWSLRYGQDASMRTEATMMANELMDQIRASGIAAEETDSTIYTNAYGTDDVSNGCAAGDASALNARRCFYNSVSTLPAGNGFIIANGSAYNVTITWLNRGSESTGAADCVDSGGVWSHGANPLPVDYTLEWPDADHKPAEATCLKSKTWVVQI